MLSAQGIGLQLKKTQAQREQRPVFSRRPSLGVGVIGSSWDINAARPGEAGTQLTCPQHHWEEAQGTSTLADALKKSYEPTTTKNVLLVLEPK